MMTRSWLKRGMMGVAVLAGLALACAPSSPAADQPGPTAKPASVMIAAFAFTPAALEIAAGQSVTWINRDDTPHQVVSAGKRFRSPGLDTDETYTFTFTEPGSYPYFCGLHPRMTGTVVVK